MAGDLSKSETQDLLKSVQEIAASSRRGRQVPAHLVKTKTPWNPTGERLKEPLIVTSVSQNGARINPRLLNQEEIHLINGLKTGVYLGKKVRVTRRKKKINIEYSNKTVEQRMNMKGQVKDFLGMLQGIHTEMEMIASGKMVEADDDDSDF